LGVINEGVVVKKKLTFRNTGNDALRVYDVTTSCGCTLAKPSSEFAAPGDSLSLGITFNTKSFSGPVRKDIFFYTNDSTQLYDSIEFIARIHPILKITPRYVNFYVTHVDSAVKKEFTILNNTDSTVHLKSILSPNRQITARLNKRELPAHSEGTVDVVLTPSKTGRVLGQLIILTDIPGKDTVWVSYTGMVRRIRK
jgi:hypothetical protein